MGMQSKARTGQAVRTLFGTAFPLFVVIIHREVLAQRAAKANDAHIPVHYPDVRKKELELFPTSFHPFHRDEEHKKDEACSSSASSALYNLKQGL
jgi:hypothetical protein